VPEGILQYETLRIETFSTKTFSMEIVSSDWRQPGVKSDCHARVTGQRRREFMTLVAPYPLMEGA